ncbi:KCTD15 [Cordylochernes scorpioides]|uniref:KCTD15 n=1 Tax=Cordylochernes scorpioides TaxID=51811 RepID=A0ABY6LCW8_9ARAC|nr:KCTD15 [Cordylochernes scorpioides]
MCGCYNCLHTLLNCGMYRSWMEGKGSSPEANFNHKISGIPCVAAASRYTAPVHIDVGGTIYTSSLETLTKHLLLCILILCLLFDNGGVCRHSDSRLARMFNGSIPIVLDSLKQHYFIDRDGKMFRHILNFLRTNSLAIPEDFSELELLLEEARFYDIPPLVKMLEGLKKERKRNSISNSNNLNGKINNSHYNSSSQPNTRHSNHHMQDGRVSPDCRNDGGEYQCLALNISPDLGERLVLSGERALVEDVFPEICQALMDGRSGVAWNQDSKHVIRFPLNGYCKLNSLQTITRLLNHGFRIMASNGGGVEGQQFSEYLFVRKAYPL